MHQRLLFASFLIAGCAATVSTTPPAQPMPPPPHAAQPPPPPPAGPPAVVVVEPAKHPAYLRALTDLRHARAYLVKDAKTGTTAKWDEKRAIGQIDDAIKEIRGASIDDGKNLNDHPQIDVGLVWGDRLHRSLELVETARRDVNEEEDNRFANGLKNRALGHIDNAARDIKEGMEDAQHNAPPAPPPVEPAHPAYLHALTDLRAARFLLEKPAQPDVKWDESRSVREIDAAIKAIKEAAIDDGKDLNDHPPIDAALNHRARLERAMQLLHGAAEDIEKREDNNFSKGLRKRAVDRIRDAERFVREAIHDRNEDKRERNEEKREEKAEKHHGH